MIIPRTADNEAEYRVLDSMTEIIQFGVFSEETRKRLGYGFSARYDYAVHPPTSEEIAKAIERFQHLLTSPWKELDYLPIVYKITAEELQKFLDGEKARQLDTAKPSNIS